MLEEYIPVDSFRTVLFQQAKNTAGITEIPVEIELEDKFMKALDFPVPWDGKVYGYVRKN